MLTIKDLLDQLKQSIIKDHNDYNSCRLLLCHVLNCSLSDLYIKMYDEISQDQLTTFMKGIERYQKGEPIQHIIGHESFYGREFIVNQDVLIPRYETEELIEHISYCINHYFKDYQSISACDIGTGSGAIAITLKCEYPNIQMWASDISQNALKVAKENASVFNVDVNFIQGDMLLPYIESNVKVDLLISNPPYIPNDTILDDRVYNYEPHLALFGGEDGLDFYRKIFKNANDVLNEKAVLAFEIGYDQGESIVSEIKKYFPGWPYEVIKDINQKDRMVFIYKNIQPSHLNHN